MKLPNAHLALVEQEKITGYLLNFVHRYGASKARFFAGFGFLPEAWEVLAAALREHRRAMKWKAFCVFPTTGVRGCALSGR